MKTQQSYISVCIPTSDMRGLGAEFLKNNFDILIGQTFKDFDVVVSDNSTTDAIEKMCETYKDKLAIHYFKNDDPARGMCTNVNNVIKKATGKLIKIIFLDDYLYSSTALAEIAEAFDMKRDYWLVTACEHTKDGKTYFRPFYPQYNDRIHLGKNTISSPTVMTIRNENPLLFDEKLTWMMDCDYYKRMYDRYGKPKILNKINAVIREGEHQTTNEMTQKIRQDEYNYMVKKFHEHNSKKLQLKTTTLVAVSGINPEGAARALMLSMQGVEYYEVVLIAHRKPADLDPGIIFKQCKPTELVNKDKSNTTDYSKFMAYNLCDYITSDYCLIVHNDALVLRPHKWSDEFYKYDYIGAPWRPNEHFTNEGVEVRVGNGGFSFRSKRMLNALNELKLPFTDNGTGYYNEDGLMCVYHRKALEDAGITFAPVDVAARFSLEKNVAESNLKPFGYHNNKSAVPAFYFLKFEIAQAWKNKKITPRNVLKKIKPLRSLVLKARALLAKKSRPVEVFDKNKILSLISKDAPVVFEIGAANGGDSVEFLRLISSPKLKLFTFEPEPKNIEVLERDIHDTRFHLYKGAVSDVDGKLTFNRSRTDDPNAFSLSGSIMKPKNHLKKWSFIHFDQTLEVDSIRLDTFCKKNAIGIIDFIWCDVQGAEAKVIQGGKDTFTHKVKYFYTEYCNDEQYEGQPKLKEILALLPMFEVVEDYGTDVLLRNKNLK